MSIRITGHTFQTVTDEPGILNLETTHTSYGGGATPTHTAFFKCTNYPLDFKFWYTSPGAGCAVASYSATVANNPSTNPPLNGFFTNNTSPNNPLTILMKPGDTISLTLETSTNIANCLGTYAVYTQWVGNPALTFQPVKPKRNYVEGLGSWAGTLNFGELHIDVPSKIVTIGPRHSDLTNNSVIYDANLPAIKNFTKVPGLFYLFPHGYQNPPQVSDTTNVVPIPSITTPSYFYCLGGRASEYYHQLKNLFLEKYGPYTDVGGDQHFRIPYLQPPADHLVYVVSTGL